MSVQKPLVELPNEVPPTVPAAKPMQIASIYIGDLDQTITEPQLVEYFKPFGTILNVRVCRDIITQRSLGYGYVNYDNHDDAERAIETLNFKRIGEKCVRLMWQQRDPALRYSGNGNIFVKNLESGVDSKKLHELFTKFGAILSCKIMEDEEGKSRGYGFVHFKEESSATSAIEKMNGSDAHANDEKRALYVANFIRRNARIAALVANFTNVYIKQVLPDVDREVIEKFFAKFGGITSAAACKDKNGRVFAFCNFANHDDAVKAIEAVHDQHVEGLTESGETIYVQRAQPRSERLIALRQKYMQCQSLGNNLYVRNFDLSFTDDNLLELFREYGDVKSCRIMTDANGTSRGFGFVSFANAEQANAALREMNGRMLNNKPLIVNIAQRRDQRYTMLRMQFQQRLHMMMRQLQQQHQHQQMAFGAAMGAGRGGNVAGMPSASPAGRGMRGGRHMRANGRGGHMVAPPVDVTAMAAASMADAPSVAAAAPVVSSTKPITPVPAQKPTPALASTRTPSHTSTTVSAAPAVASPTPLLSPGQAPETPPLPPISVNELVSMSPEEQRAALGDRLFIKVCEVAPEYAPKITGMFLEMSYMDAYELLQNQKVFMDRVTEALCVLKAHNHAL